MKKTHRPHVDWRHGLVISMFLFTWPLSLLAASTKAADSLPAQATDSSARDTWHPGSSFFPILPWDPQHGWQQPWIDRLYGLDSIAECNFTIAGFVQPRDLPLCEKLGMKAIMVPLSGDGPWPIPWRGMTDEQIDQRIKDIVVQTGNSPAILGYFLEDEPGVTLFPALGKAVAAVWKYAPGKLSYINLFPRYATIGAPDLSQLGTNSFTEYLERFVREVKPQFISYDNYMVQYSDDLQNLKNTASYYNDLMEVRRVAGKHNLPFWNIVSSNQIRSSTTIPSPANLAFQAYTTLAAGGRGISWYTYYSNTRPTKGYDYAPIDQAAGLKTESWYYLQMINRELKIIGPMMNPLTSTGVFFTAPPPIAGLPLLPGGIIKSIDSKSSVRVASCPQPPIMVGEFTGQDHRDYIMIVNLSLQLSANVKCHTHKEYRKKQVASTVDGQWLPLDETNGHWLVPGHAALIRLE